MLKGFVKSSKFNFLMMVLCFPPKREYPDCRDVPKPRKFNEFPRLCSFLCTFLGGKFLRLRFDPSRDPYWLAVGGSAAYCQLVPFGYGESFGKARREQKSAGERVSALRRLVFYITSAMKPPIFLAASFCIYLIYLCYILHRVTSMEYRSPFLRTEFFYMLYARQWVFRSFDQEIVMAGMIEYSKRKLTVSQIICNGLYLYIG